MGKGKGRQSAGFERKSQRAAFRHEIQQHISNAKSSSKCWTNPTLIRGGGGGLSCYSTPSTATTNNNNNNKPPPTLPQRPRLKTTLTHLKGLLRARQSYEEYQLMEQRRRGGFLPPLRQPTWNETKGLPMVEPSYPPGWMVDDDEERSIHPTSIESLQSKCVTVLADYLTEYLHVLGRDELHAILSLLPGRTLTKLSVLVSNKNGMTNDLVWVLGRHAHVDRLCVRATSSSSSDETATVTDEGLEALIPRRMPQQPSSPESCQSTEILYDSWEDCWADMDEEGERDHTTTSSSTTTTTTMMMMTVTPWIDTLQMEGCSVGLKRLELIDCSFVSYEILEQLFIRCSCITHLSLAGSLSGWDGPNVLLHLPEWLPSLDVLDVSHCGWITTNILQSLSQSYHDKHHREPPRIYGHYGCAVATTWVVGQQDDNDDDDKEW